MPRTLRVSEERMYDEYAHKEMNVPLFAGGIDPSIVKHSGHRPQSEQTGWDFRDHVSNGGESCR